jgi:hypothetical protein
VGASIWLSAGVSSKRFGFGFFIKACIVILRLDPEKNSTVLHQGCPSFYYLLGYEGIYVCIIDLVQCPNLQVRKTMSRKAKQLTL